MMQPHRKREQTAAGRPADEAADGGATTADAAADPVATAAADDTTPQGAAPGPGPGGDAEGAGEDLARALAERDDYLDHLQRLQAEFDNYRKRVRRDQEHLRLSAAETVVESLLPVVDNLRRAVAATREHGGEQLAAGVALVYDQLVNTLAGHGLTAVEVEPGMPFDPEVHEAVMTQPSDDHDEGAVLQVMERGYLLHGRLLRPAKVIVAR
ncbi:MAG: nucleotide exchange factor GrpE [Thermoleophilia bacterium]|jgi:molecular chaperone GrpE|nr:nucleotide exchange factor GrpE [Thermoleophilia bacterium]